jgi:uncharacterized membrane protein
MFCCLIIPGVMAMIIVLFLVLVVYSCVKINGGSARSYDDEEIWPPHG